MASFSEQGAQVDADYLARALQALGVATSIPRNVKQTAELTVVDFLELTPATPGFENYQEHFNSFANQAAAAGTYNHTHHSGFNAGRHSGGPVVPGKPAMIMGFEDNYYDSAGSLKYGPEWYIEYWSPDGTSQQMLRPFYCRIDGSDSNTASNCTITHDIGSDGLGQFQVYAQGMGARSLLLNINAVGVTINPALTLGASLTTGFVFGASGANKDLCLKAGTPSGQLIFQNSAQSSNNWQMDDSGNVTTRDGMTIQNFGATGMKFGGSATQKYGFWGATPIVRPTVTGSRGANVALASLITAMANAGLCVDSTTV